MSVIGNLNQTLQCAGKCDCCEKLQSQINSLNQRIAALDNKFIPKNEKPNIINESIKGAENSIVPIIGSTIALAVSPLGPQIANATALANAANAAAAAASTAAKAAATAAAAALTKLAGIAAQIASILAAIAILQVLGSRIDAVESGLAALGNDVSRILGLILPIKNQAERAEGKANSALDKIPPIDSTANQAIFKVNELDKKVGTAISKADAANSTANQAITKVNELDKKVGTAISKADAANSTANQAITKVNELDKKVGTAISKADAANSTANQAITKVNELDKKVGAAISKADAANSTANQAITKVNELDKKVGTAISKADAANSTANQAIAKAEEALKKASIPGPRGLQGIQGKQGIQGERGKDGVNGKDGSFNMAELAGVIGILGVLQSKIANVEVISNNIRLKTDALPSTMQEALCQELTNGKCFPAGLNMWYQASPLAAAAVQTAAIVPVTTQVFALQGQVAALQGQVAALQGTSLATNAAVLAMRPVVLNTGSVVTSTNNQVTNLANPITNINNQITNLANPITNINNQVTNLANPITNINNQVTNLANPITNINNQITNLVNPITNINNQVTNLVNPITNTNTQVNNLTNQVTNLSTQVNNQTNIINQIDNGIKQQECLQWQSVEVDTVACEKDSQGIWKPTTNKVTITVIKTATGNEVEKVKKLYEEISKTNTEICLAKNNKCPEPYAVVPEWWQVRSFQKPQLSIIYREVLPDGKYGRGVWTLTIPHYNKDKNYKLSLPEYEKGDYEGIKVLNDNSKIIVNAKNETVCLQVINAILAHVPRELKSGTQEPKIGKRKGVYKKCKVKPVRCHFFVDGQKDLVPTWSKSLI
ncbi:alanine-zipper protein [Sphaerospermopsis sp. LEGE 08334]|uniref:alanine-zipper protein n=1 Tax=Sphaerospermopsis sp. LEGE 08334 TaxID=1828651 RepID=UPI001880DFC4|nr:alanine-zipper protein [Sphaerospermopsis sp. LEGE 08334]MBE9056350.1 hypothetical protein [Sphaerospermopsis sp. LEGE 08334]